MAKRSFAALGNDLYTGKRSFDFVTQWRRLLLIAGAITLLAVLVLGVRGLNPGIEFTGGSDYRLSGVSDTSEEPARAAVAEVLPGGQPPGVTVIGDSGIRVQTEQLGEAETAELAGLLAEAYDVSPSDVTSSFVGPQWGESITQQALIGLAVFLLLTTVVIAVYFRDVAMAMAALVALVHDLVVTVGIYALIGFEVTPASVIGFLTILSYSLYDTVVTFDKVREQTAGVFEGRTRTYAEQVNLGVNQTVVRSINTSVVAVLPIGSILFIGALLLGAGTLRDVSLALFVGTIVGTYSSLFVAPAILGWIKSRDPRVQEHEALVLAARAELEQQAADDAAAAEGEPVPAGATSGSAPRPPAGQRQQPRRGGSRRA